MVPIYHLTVTYGLTGLVKHTYKCLIMHFLLITIIVLRLIN